MIHSDASKYMSVFFFNDTATTEIYTLSLHDALPILPSTSGLQYTTPHPKATSTPTTSKVVVTSKRKQPTRPPVQKGKIPDTADTDTDKKKKK